ncbi:hypothetical protein [Dyadobacter jiangsuensis]|uniref:Uncharacterized protein n=1 Tax=Dyadobacter jiangsuensis TaxID=1591085 RepID=A0A2P8G0F8_9BACT|nr:hypothetical protein [Dyadobacter jiangsuensis]PSL27444.1 hypothetical protein CLV60_108302 [Dyadobacter jiangsuensis]
MDSSETVPWKYLTKVDIINQVSRQQQCVIIPNPYENVYVQVWANPATKQAQLVVDGRPLSESVQAELIRALKSPTTDLMLKIHDSTTDPAGDVAGGLDDGINAFNKRYQIKISRDTLSLQQRTESGAFKSIAKVQANYRTNGPAIVRPNPASPHPAGSRGYRAKTQPISSGTQQLLKKGGQGLNVIGSEHFNKFSRRLGYVGAIADSTEIAKHVVNKDYDKAKQKAAGAGGSMAGGRLGASAGARAGMLLPIPHPVARVAVVALMSLAGGVTGAIYGEDGAKWLYALSKQKATEPFKAFPTDLNNDQFKTYIDSKRLFDPEQEVFGYTKAKDGTLVPLRRSDLGE